MQQVWRIKVRFRPQAPIPNHDTIIPETYPLEDFLVVAEVFKDGAIRVPPDGPVRFLLPKRLYGELGAEK